MAPTAGLDVLEEKKYVAAAVSLYFDLTWTAIYVYQHAYIAVICPCVYCIHVYLTICGILHVYTRCIFIHSVFCLTTGSKPPSNESILSCP